MNINNVCKVYISQNYNFNNKKLGKFENINFSGKNNNIKSIYFSGLQFTVNSKITENNKNCKKFKNLRKIYNYNTSISFGNIITPSSRIVDGKDEISEYIKKISDARKTYGAQEVIDLGIGNPDLPPSDKCKESISSGLYYKNSHKYNPPLGDSGFKAVISKWYSNRFGVKNIDPKNEVLITNGASEAINLILLAYTNPGDKILVPNLSYDLHKNLAKINNLKVVELSLTPENNYFPDFSKLSQNDLNGVKCMILNYPHNPTGVFATRENLEKAVKFAKDKDIIIIYDMDNSEVHHYDKKPMSILEVDGAKDIAFQVNTMSKSYNMPGMRVGFMVSNKNFIDNIAKIKHLSGSSVYLPLQRGAISALKDYNYTEELNNIYRDRKDFAVERMKELGCKDIKPSEGTYYLWVKVPDGFTSKEFFNYALNKAHVALTPGTVFGSGGEGYVRIVMSADKEQLGRAFDKMKKANVKFDTPKYKLPEELQAEIEEYSK